MDRNAYPDCAFAYVGKINGYDFKLFRHHTEKAKNGNDHDTVNPTLLRACIRTVNTLPIDNSTKVEIKAHLLMHAASIFKLDTSDPETAIKILSQQDGGSPEVANKNLTKTEHEVVEPPMVANDDKNSPNKAGQATAQEDLAKAGKVLPGAEEVVPSPEKAGSDKPLADSEPYSTGKTIDVDNAEKLINNPNTDKVGKASVTEEEDKKKVNEAVKKHKKSKKKRLKRSTYSANDLVLSKSGIIGIVNEIKDEKPIVTAIKNGEPITEEFELLAQTEADLKSTSGGIIFLDNAEHLIGSPNQDKVGKASFSKLVLAENLTEVGRKLVINRFAAALKGKTIAKIQKVTKVASVEMVDILIGDKDYPMYFMVNVTRNGEGKVTSVKILNESLPGEALEDFAKFLKDLSTEAYDPYVEKVETAKADIIPDLATAPAKLEKCTKDVLADKVKKYKEKHGGKDPSEKERKAMESSAYAICTASLKKSGTM